MQYAKPVTLNVEECDRLSFLPYLFGQDFLYAEASVYALAKQIAYFHERRSLNNFHRDRVITFEQIAE